ncbi:MAG: 23S rRNA (adenine(2503)-C(2))-methyltransferase RlmN [Phycisphaerae bacterium]|nr:23S rRNA (adenine(2503)-C(2))-methyltransferase RlmN [Phycisphaerae bacterium]
MENILGYNKDELKSWLKASGLKPFRADQILQWIFDHGATGFDQMTNLSKLDRDVLSESLEIYSSEVAEVLKCHDGTVKLLLKWPDGALTETVLMFHGDGRRTVCISSQVGCPVGCSFCASGLDGLQRSLTAAEMIEQVMWARQQLDDEERISNVVLMGMGEPFANYQNVIDAIGVINSADGINIGARHITVSTVGVPHNIRNLAAQPLQITLAISLHAASDELRQQLIPWAKTYKLLEVFGAVDDYYNETHREVTLEYVMLEGVNCREADSRKLARWAIDYRCNVNLINYNPVKGVDFQPASKATVDKFMNSLTRQGVNVHLRKSKGGKIAAACGQLRKRHL